MPLMAHPTLLLLLRHGIAEERGLEIADGDRSLTEPGRRRTRAVLERAVALGLGVERLIASPLLRARQTGELAVAAGLAPSLELDSALAPGADPLPLISAWLREAAAAAGPDRPSLALVGHEPDLGDLAARLIGAASGSLALRKAGLAQLAWEPASATASQSGEELGAWQLRLLLAPKVLLR